MERDYDFADERRWSTSRLHARFHELRSHLEQKDSGLNDDRKRQINDELSHLAFEGLQREQAKKKAAEELAWMEQAYDEAEDCPTEPIDTTEIRRMLDEPEA